VYELDVINRSWKELADINLALDEAAIVAITDAKGKITYVNDKFCQISQYSRDELLGKDHRLINSGYHSKLFFEELWGTLLKPHVWRGEIRNRAKDGSYYWLDTTIVPFINETTDEPYQYIAVRKDISYLKRLEEELRVLNEGLEARVHNRTLDYETANLKLELANHEISETLLRLQESERMRETFVSALTHDLRTPLVAEHRALELLQSQKKHLPEKIQGLTERLIKNNDDLLEMVNKLLDIYHYEAGTFRLLLGQVSLGDSIRDCLVRLIPLAESKKILIENKTSSNLGLIKADVDQINRLLVNLLGNALQHLPSGSCVIIHVEDKDGNFELIIQDNGPGISPELIPYLFDRYFVMGQNRRRIGSGLGLSICKMITKLHNGSIRVESQLGQGTTFLVTLPKDQG
jgi:PAS domain S-box-containing protein